MKLAMKTLIKGLLSSVLAAGVAGGAFAQERIAIGTASTGSNPYVVGSVMAKVMTENSDLEVGIQSTGGYNENLGLVSSGQMDVAFNFIPQLLDARAQTGKFETAQGTEMFKNLQLLFPVYLATYHYIVRQDSGITTFEELQGHRFNINVPSTATHGINMKLIAALGYTPDDFKIVNLTGKDTYNALRNRLTDASGTSIAIGGGKLLELAASVPVELLEVSDEAYEKLNVAFNNTLVRTTIPANTYSGQEHAVRTFSIPTALFTRADVDEETVYQFTKAYWDHWDEMTPDARTLKDVDAELAASFSKIQMHTGAQRYFRERGLID